MEHSPVLSSKVCWALQLNSVEGEQQRGMHVFKCADVAAAKELNEKVLEYV